MTTFPGSPKLLKCGIVLMEAETWTVKRVIALQYNPDSLTRSLQMRGAEEGGDRSEAMRLTGPPVETISLEAEIDATDQLEFPEKNRDAVRHGIHFQLALLETIVYPSSRRVEENDRLASLGTMEIEAMEALTTLFVWGKNRILPVRITEFKITEEAFDTQLNPIRAKVSLGMRVLSGSDVGFGHRAGNLFHVHHKQKERFADTSTQAGLSDLGIRRIT